MSGRSGPRGGLDRDLESSRVESRISIAGLGDASIDTIPRARGRGAVADGDGASSSTTRLIADSAEIPLRPRRGHLPRTRG